MLISQIRLPFTLGEVYGGFAEGGGLMYVARDTMILEFQVKDAIFGVVKSKPKRLQIPFREIIAIEYKRTMFISRIIFRLTSLQYMSDIPGDNKGGDVKLRIKRKDKEMARNLVSHINLRMSEIRLDMMDDEF